MDSEEIKNVEEDKDVEIKDVEEWKNIPEFSNYMVSSHGRVKNKKTNKLLKLRTNAGGYKTITIRNDQKHPKTMRAHRLVLMAFVGFPPPKHEADHIDRKRGHNHINNLRWVLKTVNSKNRCLLNIVRRAVVQIDPKTLKIIKKYDSITDAANDLKCNVGTICRVVSGRRKTAKGFLWKYETEKVEELYEKQNDEIFKDLIILNLDIDLKNYQVSNYGTVILKSKPLIARNLTISNGYKSISFYVPTKKKNQHFQVHILVAHLFCVGWSLNKPFVNHKNRIKTDNRWTNLEWCDQSENTLHWISDLYKSVLQIDTLTNRIIKKHDSVTSAANFVNGHATNIISCCKNKSITAYGFKWEYLKDNKKRQRELNDMNEEEEEVENDTKRTKYK